MPYIGHSQIMFTKSLQGSQFQHFRNTILGILEDDIPVFNTSRNTLLKGKIFSLIKINQLLLIRLSESQMVKTSKDCVGQQQIVLIAFITEGRELCTRSNFYLPHHRSMQSTFVVYISTPLSQKHANHAINAHAKFKQI